MLITLQQIRDKSPCTEGWRKLLASLGNPSDMTITVSIGQIARSNGPDDALWCLRCTEFDRRDVVRAILPSVKRASVHTIDKRVHDCIAVIDAWIAGNATNAELQTAADAAARATAYAVARAARAADAAYAAADAAARATAYAAARAADAAYAAAYAAARAARAARAAYAARAARAAYAADAAYAAADAARATAYAERAKQVEDICAVFP